MMTQQETIIWHKYPDEKPNAGNNCCIIFCDEDNYIFTGWYFNDNDMSNIIAWAEMPVGWKEEK